MKKIFSLILAVALMVSVAACGNNAVKKTTASTETTTPTDGTTSAGTTTSPSSGTTNTTATTGTTKTTSTQGTTSGSTASTVTPTKPVVSFDEDNIVLSFGAISDIHLERGGSIQKFQNALQQLGQKASENDKDGLDAVVVVGDIVEYQNQIINFKTTSESSGLDCELLFNLGNHDQEIGDRLTLQNFYNVLGSSYFSNDIENDLRRGYRHCMVNGYHFLFVQPAAYHSSSGDEVSFDATTVKWLDRKLSEITTEEPDAYVFVFVHAMINNTCYGSTYKGPVYGGSVGSYWYTDALTSTLDKYPQAITFSGHLHFPINDERSIMQNNFTAIGCGSVSYMAIENGYDNVSGAKTEDSSDISSGHLVQVDKNGNVKITRLDFSDNTEFKTPWILSAPNAQNTHLLSYSAARGEEGENKAPVMNGSASVETRVIGSSTAVTLTFTAGTDDDLIHHYSVRVINADRDRTVSKFLHLSDYYKYPNPSEMSKEVTVSLGMLTPDVSYRVEITAFDSWGLQSNVFEYSFKLSASGSLTDILPEPYADINFENGTATDAKGNLNITLNGASVSNTTLTFGGNTKTLGALVVSKSGNYAIATFKNYTSSTISNFYNSADGFSVEALYINRAPSGTQGIFCGTQNGGWGLATTESGKPGLCTYIGSGSTYYYTKDSAVASTSEMTHVVATVVTVNGTTYTSLYVNGKIAANASNSGSLYVGSSTNSFGIGGDIDTKGTATDFPMTNFAVADIKIYSEALNQNQVKTAYNNALALFN